MKTVEIVPSLLSADFAFLCDEIKKVEGAGCKRLHLDIMDGHFVPNISIGPVVVKSIRKSTELYLEVHLMIENAQKYIDDFVKAGSDLIIIHLEACSDIMTVIGKIKKSGVDVGVCIKPDTPAEVLEDIAGEIDMVLVMSVEPGFGGQSYIKGSENKIMRVKKILDRKKLDIPIEVDGGINTETAPLVSEAGATLLVAGNAIFNGDVLENIEKLVKSAGG